jgi:hypothetical protein
MPTNFPGSVDSYATKIDNVSDVLAADVNNLQDAVVALQNKVGTNSTAFAGKASGTNTVAAFTTAASAGSYTSMWTRRGVGYLATVSSTGSQYAPAGGVQYTHNSGQQGIYSWGDLNYNASNAGAFVIHHINSSGTEDRAWQFVGGTGDFISPGNVTAYSDIRLKTDLVKIADALAKVGQLTGYTYTRTDSGARQTGLVAQDVQKVLPEAVVEGEHLSLAYGNLMGLMVEAVKELTARVEKLEGR